MKLKLVVAIYRTGYFVGFGSAYWALFKKVSKKIPAKLRG